MEVVPFSTTIFTCGLKSLLGVNHSYKDLLLNFSYGPLISGFL
jgi:hypothetical protein